ncbi:hypothetical protein CPC08DRAFT_770728 [Agrocybe pediades]|nr:hypothetical protein CPC08DRAFT_770728 [Agrocybe pediades]
MVNPGVFRGLRKEFLLGEKDAYAKGVLGGYAADVLAAIQRRYFKRFPIDLPHDQEPTSEHLSAVDDDAPDIELPPLDETAMTPAEYQAEMTRRRDRQELIEFRKAQIKHRMAYQYMKDHDLDPKDSGAHNPFRPLLFKLTGNSGIRPRRKAALNVWRVSHRTEIEDELKRQIAADNIPRRLFASQREKIAKEMFEKLPKDVQDGWENQAAEEHAIRMEKWNQLMKGEISTSPAERQKCIQGLVQFMQPILDLLCEATGWHATLITGGPEPAHGGRLNVVSVHSGTTAGDVKMNFGRAKRRRYKEVILPIYGQYLKKCFSPAECQARALAVEEGFAPLDEAEMEEAGATTDVVDLTTPTVCVTGERAAQDIPSTTPSSQSPLCSKAVEASSTIPAAPRPASPPPSVPPSRLPSPRAPSPPPSRLPSPRAPSLPPSRPPSPPAPSSRPSRPPPPAPSRCHSLPPPPAPSRRHSLPPRHTPQSISPPHLPSQLLSVSPAQASPAASALAAGTEPKLMTRSGSSSTTVVGRSDSSVGERSLTPIASATRPTRKRGWAEDKTPLSAQTTDARPAKRNKSGAPTSNLPASVPSSASASVSASASSSSTATHGFASTVEIGRIPSDAEPWFKKAMEMLRGGEDLGPRWSYLLDVWTEFEHINGYREVSKLKNTHRPKCIADWIQRALYGTSLGLVDCAPT